METDSKIQILEDRLYLDRSNAELNYRGIKTIFYRNGDQFDPGTLVVLSRREFKHWITLLDYLTIKLQLSAPAHKVYRIDGSEISQFEMFESNGRYVVVASGPFIFTDYCSTEGHDDKKWNFDPKIPEPYIGTLDSAESIDIYLKRCGYKSTSGLPYPLDGNLGYLHMCDTKYYLSPSPTGSTVHNKTAVVESVEWEKSLKISPKREIENHQMQENDDDANNGMLHRDVNEAVMLNRTETAVCVINIGHLQNEESNAELTDVESNLCRSDTAREILCHAEIELDGETYCSVRLIKSPDHLSSENGSDDQPSCTNGTKEDLMQNNECNGKVEVIDVNKNNDKIRISEYELQQDCDQNTPQKKTEQANVNSSSLKSEETASIRELESQNIALESLEPNNDCQHICEIGVGKLLPNEKSSRTLKPTKITRNVSPLKKGSEHTSDNRVSSKQTINDSCSRLTSLNVANIDKDSRISIQTNSDCKKYPASSLKKNTLFLRNSHTTKSDSKSMKLGDRKPEGCKASSWLNDEVGDPSQTKHIPDEKGSGKTSDMLHGSSLKKEQTDKKNKSWPVRFDPQLKSSDVRDRESNCRTDMYSRNLQSDRKGLDDPEQRDMSDDNYDPDLVPLLISRALNRNSCPYNERFDPDITPRRKPASFDPDFAEFDYKEK